VSLASKDWGPWNHGSPRSIVPLELPSMVPASEGPVLLTVEATGRTAARRRLAKSLMELPPSAELNRGGVAGMG
jgi:hypothetical protein